MAQVKPGAEAEQPRPCCRRFAPAIPAASRIPDAVFGVIILLTAISVFAIVVLVAWELIDKSRLSLHQFGLRFFYGHDWDPVNGSFGAVPFIYGTLVSSFLALLLAVPLSIGVAVYITEMCPQRLRAIISFLVELLAAIPSVIYGLWGIFVLAPLLREYVEPFLAKTLGWTGLFTRPDVWSGNAGGGHHPGDHGCAGHRLDHPRGDDGGAAEPA